MYVLGAFYRGAIWVCFNIVHPGLFCWECKKTKMKPEGCLSPFFYDRFFGYFSLDKQIIKTKRNSQGSARFFLSLAFLVSLIFKV